MNIEVTSDKLVLDWGLPAGVAAGHPSSSSDSRVPAAHHQCRQIQCYIPR